MVISKHYDRRKIKDIVKKYNLELVLLFGSSASGNINAGSDIDIAVYGKHILSEKEKIALILEFSNIFYTDKIDIIDIKTASPLLKKEIFKCYRILYRETPLLLYQLELVSIYEYKESEILYQMQRERLQEFVQ